MKDVKDEEVKTSSKKRKGKGKNEVMKQWLKGWDEENLKEDVQLNEEVIKVRVVFEYELVPLGSVATRFRSGTRSSTYSCILISRVGPNISTCSTY